MPCAPTTPVAANPAMNRSHLIGPESVLAAFTALLFWFCSQHNSGGGRDAAIMEKLIWLIPFVVAGVGFSTVVVPGSKDWWWLGRAIGFSYIATFVCGYRLIAGLGDGPKGQDAAMILLIVLCSVAVAIGTSICGAMILAANKPAFANWFHGHKVLGSFLTALAMIPIGFALGIIATFISALLLGFYVEVLKR